MKNLDSNLNKNYLVIGGTGKTGRRVVQRLQARNIPVSIGSRRSEPPFDWQDPTTWTAVLQGMTHIYVTFYPDLAIPDAPAIMQAFTDLAVQQGVQRLVLLSGRGEEEAQKSERIVQNSGIEWTIVRASWFNQNFSEGLLHELVMSGQVTLPVGDVGEPFIDAEDIADVATAALLEDEHVGQLYEVTGPRLLTFSDAVKEIAKATGQPIEYLQIPHEAFLAGMAAQGLPEEMIALTSYLFTTVLDGRNESLADGVQRALGRKPRDFSEYVQKTAKSGVWQMESVPQS